MHQQTFGEATAEFDRQSVVRGLSVVREQKRAAAFSWINDEEVSRKTGCDSIWIEEGVISRTGDHARETKRISAQWIERRRERRVGPQRAAVKRVASGDANAVSSGPGTLSGKETENIR